MMKLVSFPKVIFSMFSIATAVADAASIKCNRTSAHASIETPSTMATVQVLIEGGDLLAMEKIEFDGIGDDDNNVVFVKANTASRTTSVGRADEVVWHGTMMRGMGFATFVQSETGDLSGSFTTPNAAYSIITMPDGSTQVKVTAWKDFPDADAIEEDETSTKTRSAPLNSGPSLSADATFFPDRNSHFALQVETKPEAKPRTPGRVLRGGNSAQFAGHRRVQQDNVVVDVLVIVTNRAFCEYTGQQAGCEPTDTNTNPIKSRMPVLQEQTNNALAQVGVAVETRIVEVVFLQGTFDGRPTANTLNALLSDRNVNQWRQESGADLVAMITGADRFTCGIAYLNTHVSATSYSCLDSYTFTHELGHNFGANHDRNNVFSRNQFHPYGHGFSYEGQFRTIMAYNCPGGCARVPLFSANDFQLSDGRPVGDGNHDNARLITENAPRMAALQPTMIVDTVNQPDTPTSSPSASPTAAAAPTSPVAPVLPPTTTDTELSCPTNDRCPAKTNPVSRGILLWCRQACVEEGTTTQALYRIFGFECGTCPDF